MRRAGTSVRRLTTDHDASSPAHFFCASPDHAETLAVLDHHGSLPDGLRGYPLRHREQVPTIHIRGVLLLTAQRIGRAAADFLRLPLTVSRRRRPWRH